MQPHTPTRAVLLFAHGSRQPGWGAPMEAVAARMRALAPHVPVACAYLELMTPNLADCVQDLVQRGAQQITIWPMFLGAGRHVREDLPQMVAALRAAHPALELCLKEPIGEHPDVLACLAATALG